MGALLGEPGEGGSFAGGREYYERKALGTGISLHGGSVGQNGVGSSTRDYERWLKGALELERLFLWELCEGNLEGGLPSWTLKIYRKGCTNGYLFPQWPQWGEPCPRAMFGSNCNVTQTRIPSDVECRSEVVSCDDWPFRRAWGEGGRSRGDWPELLLGFFLECLMHSSRLPAFSPSTSGSLRPTRPAQWRLRHTTTPERLSGRREYVHG